MFFVSVLRNALLICVPISLILTTYLYLYPVFHLCAFPSPEENGTSEYIHTLRQHTPFPSSSGIVAPFRLLALGDPQLEGESSIRDIESITFPNFRRFWKDALLLDGTEHNPIQRLRHSLHDAVDFWLDDIPKALEVYRKRLDHIGNDYYLGHIYRTLHWWSDPTHVTVLGDLVGSQWIDDDEFEERGWRFWNRVFGGGIRVEDELASTPSDDFQNTKILGDDAAAWKKRLINVAGNHDIGYAGDISPSRMERFGKVFGKPNYEMRFLHPVSWMSDGQPVRDTGDDEKPIPELRIVVLNDMNLDTPAGSKEVQDETYAFLNNVITTSKDVTRPAHFTLVLTHIPMHKKAGICVDGPFFDFFDGHFEDGVKEQNHLSPAASNGLLEGIFGMSGSPSVPGQGFGRNGVVLTGHDHEGCDVYHYINHSEPLEREWKATKWNDAVSGGVVDEVGVPGLREITVRSMMGDFGGNAGMLSLWFDKEDWDWKFEFVNCPLGTQHIWWLVHILDLITLGIGIVYGGFVLVEKLPRVEVRVVKSKPIANGIMNGRAKSEKDEEPATIHSKTNGAMVDSGSPKKSPKRKKGKGVLAGANGSIVSTS